MPFSSIGNLLPGAARRAGIHRDLDITAVLRGAQRGLEAMFGAQYSKYAEAVALRADGSLIIACRSPAVAQTVRIHAQEVLTSARAGSTARVERLFLIPRSPNDLTAPPPLREGDR